jgi:hypothetical protein
MRDLKRNKQTIWYSLLNVSTDTDEWGNTEDVKTYGEPLQMDISISGNRGEASQQAFGTDLKYDREMSTHDMACPIDEYSHLWLDGRSPDETHNYIVKAVSKTLNCIRYAIEKVNVS